MKKYFVLSIMAVILILYSSLASAEIFKVVDVDYGNGKIQGTEKASGKFLWQQDISIQKMKYKGDNFIYVEKSGSGLYGKDGTYKTWDSKSYYFFQGNTLTPYQSSLVFKDKNGNVIQTLSKYYEKENLSIICKIDNREKDFDYSNDIVDNDNLSLVLANYPFDEKRDISFRFISNEPAVYKMTLKYIGTETLSMAGESITTYKLQMIPDLGALNLIGAFVPKTYFWFTASTPHKFVRYEGLESGLGTPYIVMETAP